VGTLPGRGILDWIASACAEFSERAAIERADRHVSYEALNARANHVAECLGAGGVGPGSIVAVVVPDRVEIIPVLLGVFRAGGVFAPLDAEGPPERLRQLFTQLSPDAVVVATEQRERLSTLCDGSQEDRRAVVTVTAGLPPEVHGRTRSAGSASRSAGNEPVAAPAGRREMAYVYYTSGSTGRPKGIAGTLRGLSHFVDWETRTFGIGPGWRLSQFTIPTFDPFFRDVLVPLCTGGTICIPPDLPFNLGPERLMDWIDGQRINLIHCVPSLFGMMLEADLNPRPCQALRYVLLAGEVLQPPHVRTWRETFGDRIGLVNLYGSTETTMVKFSHTVQEEDLERGFIPIGRPIDGAEARLVDEQGMACPPGTVGEVHVKSHFLTLGYYGDPAATEAAFYREAGGSGGDARVYRTGDLAVLLEDGNYRFLGRKDDQVKVRGLRVEPAEVTAALLQYPLVKSCAVVARTMAREETALVAYIIPVARNPIRLPELRTFLRRRLPLEMVPSAFVCLDELPLTARGKVDRTALPPPPGRSALPDAPLAPRTPTEAALADLWCELLGLDEVGVRDHFLDLGGHSLTAVRLASRVRSWFGLDIPARTAFDRPTVEKMAEYVAQELSRWTSIADAKGAAGSP
jgi:amino acid adenylation domain-containing protein